MSPLFYQTLLLARVVLARVVVSIIYIYHIICINTMYELV